MFIGMEPLYVPGESADGFYGRLLNDGDLGVKSLDLVQNFVDISLRLPEVEETIGAFA